MKTPRRESLLSRRERLKSQLAIIESQKGSRWRQTYLMKRPKSHHQGPSWRWLRENIFSWTEIPGWKHQEERDQYRHWWWLGVKKDQDEGKHARRGGQNPIIKAQVGDDLEKISSEKMQIAGWKHQNSKVKVSSPGLQPWNHPDSRPKWSWWSRITLKRRPNWNRRQGYSACSWHFWSQIWRRSRVTTPRFRVATPRSWQNLCVTLKLVIIQRQITLNREQDAPIWPWWDCSLSGFCPEIARVWGLQPSESVQCSDIRSWFPDIRKSYSA